MTLKKRLQDIQTISVLHALQEEVARSDLASALSKQAERKQDVEVKTVADASALADWRNCVEAGDFDPDRLKRLCVLTSKLAEEKKVAEGRYQLARQMSQTRLERWQRSSAHVQQIEVTQKSLGKKIQLRKEEKALAESEDRTTYRWTKQ